MHNNQGALQNTVHMKNFRKPLQNRIQLDGRESTTFLTAQHDQHKSYLQQAERSSNN